MKHVLMMVLLMASTALATPWRAEDGTTIDVPSTFERNAAGPGTTWNSWWHKQKWSILIETRALEPDKKEPDYSKMAARNMGAETVEDITVPGADTAFRAEWKSPNKIVIYAFANQRASVLTLENREGNSPEGFKTVVDRLSASFKLRAPTAGAASSSSWGSAGGAPANGKTAGGGPVLGVAKADMARRFEPSKVLQDRFSDGTYGFSVEYDGDLRVEKVEYKSKQDGKIGLSDVSVIKQQYPGTFLRRQADKLTTYWVNPKAKVVVYVLHSRGTFISALTQARCEKEIKAGKMPPIPDK